MPAKYELVPTSDSRDRSASGSRSSSPLPPYSPDSPSPDYDFDADFDGSGYRLEDSYDSNNLSALLNSPSDSDIEHSTFFATNPRTRETRECIRAFHADPRFNRPPPSTFSRVVLIAVTAVLFYVAFAWRKAIWVDFGMGMGDHVEVVDGVY